MSMIRLFVLGFKGFYLLKNLPANLLDTIDSVIIAKDPSIENDYFDDICKECIMRKINFFQRKSEPSTEASYSIFVGWRWLSNVDSKSKVIVFHDSLLPKYRGFNPLVTSLINGDTIIGATCLLANAEYDKGNIISQQSKEITYPVKIEDAITIMADIYLNLLIDFINSIKNKSLQYYPQNEAHASYSLWRDEQDYFIDWNWDANKIERFVNAVGFPYLGARTRINNEVVLIKNVKAEPEDVIIANRDTGKVLFKSSEGITIVCGKGLLTINEIHTIEGAVYSFKDKFRIRFQ
ncbi:methionyl-tRNA formyltransferase [Ferruginibacter albus]|uniref:methionyl-tRNA formyltransferase n=1 Tax=Ferruginibacter albus TaxID=2875540 RepID=UPI001CC4C792|nr:formyltransferase family protein [Ferruginibacter albus]UAY50700.1 hypothetical protein K9M53_08840 [Ferruginibacter albus]